MFKGRRAGNAPDAAGAALGELARLVAALEEQVRAFDARVEDVRAEQERALQVLQLLYDDEPGNRRRLHELRATPAYAAAYEEPNPLVSVIIPTYTNWTALRDRALPSALAQTYEHIEVVIVGDAAPPETAAMLSEVADQRVRFQNLPLRGPYPEDPRAAWFVSGVPPFNAAMREARGRWIAPFSDDDALRPDAVERMIEAVRSERHEVCYGVLRAYAPDGTTTDIGEFPPRHSHMGLQGGVFHAGLRFFEQELADALFRQPNDWQMVRRMLRAGVRFGFLDRVVCDYHPSGRHGFGEPPT